MYIYFLHSYSCCCLRPFPLERVSLLTLLLVLQTGEKLLELRGHTQKLTAIIAFPPLDSCEEGSQLILTASADRTVCISLPRECGGQGPSACVCLCILKAE